MPRGRKADQPKLNNGKCSILFYQLNRGKFFVYVIHTILVLGQGILYEMLSTQCPTTNNFRLLHILSSHKSVTLVARRQTSS